MNSVRSKVLKILVLIIAILLIFIMPMDTVAATLSELNGKLASLQNDAAAINKNINNLKKDISASEELKAEYQNQIDNLETQISVCQGFIYQYQAEIKQLEDDIEIKNDELTSTIFTYKKRMRAIYMSPNTEMSLLLGSDSYSNYLANESFTKRVAAYDNLLINSINSSIKEIETLKKSVEEKNEEMLSVKRTLTSKQLQLENKMSSINDEIYNLNTKNSSLKSELEKIRKAEEEYEKKIKELIEQEKNKGNQTQISSGQFLWPVPGFYTLTSTFGYRSNPLNPSATEYHKGIDISGTGIGGKPIIAVESGIIITAGFNNGGYGNYVVISHGVNKSGEIVTTHYAHMRSYAVYAGQTVVRGQTIGYVGTTGSSTGNHLHFEIRLDNVAVNPMLYVSNVK